MNLKFAFLPLLVLLSCTQKSNRKEVWVYSSSYKEVLAMYEPEFEKDHPDLKIKWFQAGSEIVATKIQAELAAGQPKADLIMTSDLFFFQDLGQKGHLLTMPEESFKTLPEAYKDPARQFAISRFPVMVIAYHTSIPEKDRPKSFMDLTNPKYKGKLTMPSPLESGTSLTTVMFLKQKFGEEYFKKLRENDILASGGNGATMSRVQSQERPIAILLMENVLQAKERGLTQVDFILPSEGGIPMPSPLAILKTTTQPENAKKVFDWMLGDSAQRVLVKGWVYSSLPGQPDPANAPAWSSLKLFDWDLATMKKWGTERQSLKDFFQKTVLN